MIYMRRIEFLGLTLDICEGVYEPSHDTELLALAALQFVKPTMRVLEIGTGSGAIAILLAKKGAKVVATDIFESVIKCAMRNAGLNNVEIDFRIGDLFEPVKGELFDMVVFNPPYLPKSEYDHILAPEIYRAVVGGMKGNEIALRFIKELPAHLRDGGKALLVISTLSNPSEIIEIANNLGFNIAVLRTRRFFFETITVLVFSLGKTKIRKRKNHYSISSEFSNFLL